MSRRDVQAAGPAPVLIGVSAFVLGWVNEGRIELGKRLYKIASTQLQENQEYIFEYQKNVDSIMQQEYTS